MNSDLRGRRFGGARRNAAPPEPPYLLELTITSTWCTSLIIALAAAWARAESTVSNLERRTPPGPALQKVASKKVLGVAPEPGSSASGHAAGSSAPLSVDMTSILWILMPGQSSL